MEEKRIYEVTTLGEFLWKTAMYIRYGYVRYALRTIPEQKDPSKIAKKLLLHYDCTYNRDIRKQRLRQGKAKLGKSSVGGQRGQSPYRSGFVEGAGWQPGAGSRERGSVPRFAGR